MFNTLVFKICILAISILLFNSNAKVSNTHCATSQHHGITIRTKITAYGASDFLSTAIIDYFAKHNDTKVHSVRGFEQPNVDQTFCYELKTIYSNSSESDSFRDFRIEVHKGGDCTTWSLIPDFNGNLKFSNLSSTYKLVSTFFKGSHCVRDS